MVLSCMFVSSDNIGRWSYLQSWEVCGWSYLQCLVSVHSGLPSLAQPLAMCREKTTRQFQSSVMAPCNLNRQTDRQRDTQTDRHTDRHTDRETDRHTQRQTHRQRDRQRHTDRQTHRHTDKEKSQRQREDRRNNNVIYSLL